MIAALTHAREAPPIPASCATELRRADRPARAGAAAVGRRRHFFLADCCSQIRGDDGARPIGAIDDDVGGRRLPSAASYGVIATDRKICSTDSGGACSRSRSAAATAALNDHQKLAAYTMIAALTHAREAPPIPASCATELRRADRPARAGAAAVGRRRHFFLADCCSQIRGDDGARPIGAIDDDVGGRRLPSAASYGVIATDRKICSTDSGGACSRSRSAAATAALNDHQKLAAYTMIAALTHAREAPPIPASCATELRRADRPARAGAAAVGRRRHFFLADCCSQIRGDDGARPIGAIDDDVGGRRRPSAASYGVIATDRKICSTDSGGACSRSRSAAATAALNDHQKLAAYTMIAALTHAREAPPIPASCATELRRADRPARAGAAAVGRRRHFFLADCCSQIRGDDGARPIGAIDDDVGGRRRASAASYGVIATDRKICSTDSGGACSRSRSAAATAALNDHQKLAAYTMIAALTHAREAPPIPASCATELRRADRPARAGAAAVGRRRHFFLADCCSQIRGDDGARPIGAIDDDVGGRRRAAQPATGSSQQIGKSAALTVGALALARAALRQPRH